MRTSIATVCLSGTLEEKLDAIAAAGFDGVELFEQDLVVSPLSPEEVAARTRRLGLRVDLYQPFRDLEGVDEERFAENLRRLEAKLRLMARLGADTVLVCSNVATATVDDDEVMASQLRRAAELAAGYGIRIAYEALAWGTFVDTYERSWALVRRADHPALGVCLDSFHILSRGDDPAGIEAIPAEKIFFVQLADAPTLGLDVLPWSRHHRVFPGEGDFDLTTFVAHLVRAGYRGPLSLEIFNDVFREADPFETAVDAHRSLLWLQQRVRGRLGAETSDAAGLTPLPKIEPVETVDHVEVRTDRPDEVGGVLAALGFAFAGRHRRKPVHLFTAGDASVVVSPSGEPGTRLASVAVRVPDAAAAAERARRLGATPVPRPVAAGEAALHGVASPGGWSLVYVDDGAADWRAEFTGVDPVSVRDVPGTAPDAPAPLRIDHLNVPESRTRFDAAVLFLESGLRIEPVGDADVPSPRGLIRSRVLESPEAGVRIVLNQVPAGLADGMGRPAGFPGHVAFAVDDLESVAERARAAGLAPLRVPDNYYADLGARFGIPDETLDRWRRDGILVDRDERGEFLHLYTRDLGGLFLEVVERRGGYAGYGPADAAVRLAAQAAAARR